MPPAPDTDLASAALSRLVGVLGEDAMFVLASVAREPREALEGLMQRRSQAYTAAVQGQPHTRMTAKYEPWFIEMVRSMAPVSPPAWVPMMEMVREKVTLEIGARGLRSLFSSKPSDKDVARVKRYGTLAVRVLRAVLSADGPLDQEERTTATALISSLGLPSAETAALQAEGAVSPETDANPELDRGLARAIVRGAWLAAAWDTLDPREERVIGGVCRKMGIADEDSEAARREALEHVESRRRAGAAAVDGVRYVLSDRCPGLGVQLAALVGMLILPRRWRDETLAGVATGAPAILAKRHAGLDAGERFAVLGVAWAAALVDNPTVARRARLRSRWERFAADLGEDDPASRELVEHWVGEALAGIARTLQ